VWTSLAYTHRSSNETSATIDPDGNRAFRLFFDSRRRAMVGAYFSTPTSLPIRIIIIIRKFGRRVSFRYVPGARYVNRDDADETVQVNPTTLPIATSRDRHNGVFKFKTRSSWNEENFLTAIRNVCIGTRPLYRRSNSARAEIGRPDNARHPVARTPRR